MTKAIKYDRHKVVNFLLQYGFSLNVYLTPMVLLEFYEHVSLNKIFFKFILRIFTFSS